MTRLFRLVDLFAGCGGLTSGFVSTGRFTPVHAVESDRHAAATYAVNFGEHVYVGDIADRVGGSWRRADVVVGGPPCQGFSLLGRRDPGDPRNALWREYVEALRRMRPAFFVMENVPRFLDSADFAELAGECRPGGALTDYALETFVLNAADYGVAQARRRAFVVGRRRGLVELGAPDPVEDADRRALRDAFPHWLRHRDPASELSAATTSVLGRTVPGVFGLKDLHVSRPVSSVSQRRYAAVPPGGSRLDLPDDLLLPCWRGRPRGATDVMGRLSWDRPSVTVRTEFFRPEKGRFLHPEEPRPITHAEAALIQGFDESFQWCGNWSSIARQIGNAVPPPLAAAIARRILTRLG